MSKRKVLHKLLRFMTRMVLKKYHPLVIGITGSVGKSSTKEAVALMLKGHFRVRKAEGNYNNEVGIPLTVIGAMSGGSSFVRWAMVFLKWTALMLFPYRYPEILVLEMGIDRPGDMDYLLSFITPNIGIATQISSSHLAFFGTTNNIAKEKGKLIAAVPKDGYAILNADDPRTLKMQERTKGKVLTFGFTEAAMVRADNLIFHREAKRVEGYSFKVNVDGKTIPVRLPKIVGKHHIPAALAAICVGMALKMNLVEIASALEKMEMLPGRLRLLLGKDDTVLVDDTYNASPASTQAALEMMGEMEAPRKVAVLGDMLELGPDAKEAHASLADAVRNSDAQIVITVGQHMRALHDALLARGYPRNQVLWMPNPMSALEALHSLIQPHDLILIKGSQSMRMEKILEGLLINQPEARNLLCRQSREWRAKPFTPPTEWMEENQESVRRIALGLPLSE